MKTLCSKNSVSNQKQKANFEKLRAFSSFPDKNWLSLLRISPLLFLFFLLASCEFEKEFVEEGLSSDEREISMHTFPQMRER